MFSWFKPSCPVGTLEKAWTETRMLWLAEHFGLEALKGAEVIAPPDLYGDRYDGSPEAARLMLHRLCEPMRVSPETVTLILDPHTPPRGSAGPVPKLSCLEQGIVRVSQSQLADPEALAASLAHELASQLLLIRGLLDGVATDHAAITELVPVYFGAGLFGANATLREAHLQMGHVSWSMFAREGQLPSRVLGYALALFALLRGERSPTWAGYLRPDAASALKQAIRYVQNTGDSLFHPDTFMPYGVVVTPGRIVEQLQTGTASARVAALWAIRDRRLNTPEFLSAVSSCLDDEDADVATEAARVLPQFGADASVAIARLCQSLRASSHETRGIPHEKWTQG